MRFNNNGELKTGDNFIGIESHNEVVGKSSKNLTKAEDL